MKHGSLFTGIGGFDLGFDRAGIETTWQVEINVKCNEVLAHHWPNAKRYGDVNDVGKRNLEPVDVITGGFPCQDLSIAGKRKGLAGSRSGLWFQFHRVLEELRPRWCVIENVPGLLSSNGGRDFAVILQGLAEIGYLSAWRILDAQHFGMAQRRRRVFIVGSLGDGSCAEILFESESLSWGSAPSRGAGQRSAAPLTRGSASGSGVNEPGRRQEDDVNLVARPLAFGSTIDHYDESQQTYIPTAYTIQTNDGGSHKRKDRPHGGMYVNEADASLTLGSSDRTVVVFEPGNLIRRCGANPTTEIVPTLGAEKLGDTFPHVAYNWQSGGDVRLSFGLPNLQANQVPAVGVRRLTPTECERLQGFPDFWTAVNGMSDSARYRTLGNAVAVPVAEWIGRRLKGVAGYQ